MKLLIDADVLCYRAGFATDKTKWAVVNPAGCLAYFFDDAKSAKEYAFSNDIVNGVWSRKECEPEEKALMLVDVMLNDIKARYASENLSTFVVLSGVGNLRHAIATRATYKGNRSGATPPTHLRAIRSHLVSKHRAVVTQGEEADDLIAREALATPGCVVCTIDKDYFQLPVRIFNFVTKEEVTISAKEAVLNFYQQVISGDPTDNIPGAAGYGPVKARKAIEGCKNPWECWQVALGIYVKEFGDISGILFALECARLVKLGQTKDNLWEPPAAPLVRVAA